MTNQTLRLEQLDTILYNANLNPMGVPSSVVKSLKENVENVVKYPDDYYGNLRKTIAEYASCKDEYVLLGNGSSDLLRLYTSMLSPKKAILLTPSNSEYEKVLRIFNCEIDFYELKDEENFQFNLADFVSKLDSSCDMIILGNPNNPTSQIISREDIETLAAVCKELEAFLIVDEMYIEFVEDYKKITAVPLTEQFDNLAVIRSVSKFFAVPGLRLAYAIMNNPEKKAIIKVTAAPNSISTLTATACIEMFHDNAYIEESNSQIYTERNLIYSAMATNKNVRLYKPQANFMLVKILKQDVTAEQMAEHCKLKGIVIRDCKDFRGLNEKFFRFCFMKPQQNDLLVNTVLELL